jgi:hypothetical protein
MPEREYFSFRYAIPGYIFILLVVAINHVPLLRFLEITEAGEVFAALLGFLSLFAGSALGFLISQIWYWWFGRKRAKKPGVYGIDELEQVDKALIKKLQKLGLRKDAEDNKRAMLAIADYIVYRKEELLLGYARRRWDMYHVLSSTIHTL